MNKLKFLENLYIHLLNRTTDYEPLEYKFNRTDLRIKDHIALCDKSLFHHFIHTNIVIYFDNIAQTSFDEVRFDIKIYKKLHNGYRNKGITICNTYYYSMKLDKIYTINHNTDWEVIADVIQSRYTEAMQLGLIEINEMKDKVLEIINIPNISKYIELMDLDI